MSKYIVKHSLSCDELGLKQIGDPIETEDEKLVERLGNLIEKVEDTKTNEGGPIPTEPVGENLGGKPEDKPTANDDLDTKTNEELIAIAKEKGIKGNLSAFKVETLKDKIREIK